MTKRNNLFFIFALCCFCTCTPTGKQAVDYIDPSIGIVTYGKKSKDAQGFGKIFLGFFLPFLIAAVLTTSTGSITVSLIGTASIMGPLANSMNYSPEIMAALIGCGAFCVFHANSSFFWLLHKLHEVPVPILYRTFTLQSLVMGVSGLLGVVILYALGVG